MSAFIPLSGVPLSSQRYRSSRQCSRSHKKTIILMTNLPSVLVVGASHGLGLHVTKHLQSVTDHLHATYLTDSSQLNLPTDQIHKLDACNNTAVDKLISELKPHTVINCVGGKPTDESLPDREATKNILNAATNTNVNRFILISALGAGDSEESVPFQVMMTMRPMLLEKSHAESYVKVQKQIPWTIIRSAPLVDPTKDGKGAVATEGLKCYGTVDRDELAKIVVKAAISKKAVKKTLQVVDRGQLLITSPFVRPLEFWEPLPFEVFEL